MAGVGVRWIFLRFREDEPDSGAFVSDFVARDGTFGSCSGVFISGTNPLGVASFAGVLGRDEARGVGDFVALNLFRGVGDFVGVADLEVAVGVGDFCGVSDRLDCGVGACWGVADLKEALGVGDFWGVAILDD